MAQLNTTVIGSLPKPAYLKVPSWIVNGVEVKNFVEEYNKVIGEGNKEDVENDVRRATQEIIDLQNTVGLTTITDGELRRDKYVNAFCRELNGFDFVNTEKRVWRNGSREGFLPKIVSKVSNKGEIGFLAKEWRWSQEMSEIPVKMTVPGPLTIMDTFYNEFYQDDETLLEDLANCINIELKKLALAGCKQIQVSSCKTCFPKRKSRDRNNGFKHHKFTDQ